MAKLFQISFDARTEEIETAYKAFHRHYTLKKRILYTIVYAIVIVLGVDLIIKDPTGMPGYIASGLGAGILIFNWVKPAVIRKRMAKLLAELDDETYIMTFFDDRLEVETVIDKDAPTETVAITPVGVYAVEEGSEAAKELAETPPPEPEKIPKSVYKLSETEIFFGEREKLMFLFINRANIQTIPLRCLSEEQAAQVRAYFEDKGLA